MDKHLKAIDFESWGGIDGYLASTSGGVVSRASYLKAIVPWLAKAHQLTASAISGLPFDIVNDNGDVVDTSTDWGNVMGGIEYPRRVVSLLAGSLCGGAAYMIPTVTSKRIVELQYISPHTITPKLGAEGVQSFERNMNGRVEKISPDDIMYFWLPDSDVELGLPLTTPMSGALTASELLASMAATMKIYGDRGFVPAYIGNVKGMPNRDEKEKAEAYLTRFLRGAYKSIVKLVNSESLDLIRVGAGMEELKGVYTEIQKQAIEDIASAFGIPAALFMSDKSYASEVKPLIKSWYESSVFITIYQTIEETFNAQLLNRFGVRMQFKPEALSIFQEDENERSSAVTAYTNAINTNPKAAKFAMSILGVDLDEEQEAELDEMVNVKPEPEEEPVQEPKEKEPEVEAVELSPDETKDLALWYSKAKAWNLKGKGNAVDWENKHLRESIAAPIRLRLVDAKTELDIVKAFELKSGRHINDNTALLTLAASIDAVANKIVRS